jgi:glycosyltransferase involved in cell wall biosynthesis
MAGYDLICTYGAGALDVTLAYTLFADVYKLAPLVHHEGAGEGGRSNLYRRLALGRTAALVVPSREAEHIALEKWQQPRHRVRRFGRGRGGGRGWSGPLLPRLRDAPLEGLAPLIRAITTLPQEWQLVVVAEERSHEPIRAEAARAGIDDRVHPVSPPAQPARLIGLFDLFASTDGATGILEAMATGLSVIASRDSEAAGLVASENGPFLSAPGDEAECVASIARLAGDRTLRRRIGEANRTKAGAEFDEKQMIERTRALYRSLTGTR